MFECKACNGDGVDVEPVVDYGQGPWYECQFCGGSGRMSFVMRLRWFWWKWRGEVW